MRIYPVLFLCLAVAFLSQTASSADRPLAKPTLKGEVSVEEALARRRSVREFSDKSINVKEVAQLFWAAQGITSEKGKRTAPSAGALYPLSVYLVAGDVDGLSRGVYRYRPKGHAVVKVKGADQRAKLAEAAGGQRFVGDAPATFVIAVNYDRMGKYNRRGKMYADMEQGHAVQNILLQATALGLGAVPVGAISEEKLAKVLDLPAELTAEYLIPVGHPK
jgi:SagB-type dehydrogenase family enzyme